jgi:hypothetical protein
MYAGLEGGFLAHNRQGRRTDSRTGMIETFKNPQVNSFSCTITLNLAAASG